MSNPLLCSLVITYVYEKGFKKKQIKLKVPYYLRLRFNNIRIKFMKYTKTTGNLPAVRFRVLSLEFKIDVVVLICLLENHPLYL